MLAPLLALALAASPKVGEVAPDFTAKDIDGKELTLSALVKQGPVVLAFVPKAFTGGCTREMEGYRDRFKEFEAQGARILVVSMDDEPKLKEWREALKAPQTFIADPNGALVRRFDTKMPVVSLSSRVTFVIGPERTVLAVDEGSTAIDPSGAVKACALRPRAQGADAGTAAQASPSTRP